MITRRNRPQFARATTDYRLLPQVSTSGLADGAQCLVTSTGSIWVYRSSIAVVSGKPNRSQATLTGVGSWVRDTVRGAVGANLQDFWQINTATGDDNADGYNNPIKSLDELLCRWGRQEFDYNLTPGGIFVSITGDDSSNFDFDFVLKNGIQLTIQGVRTVVSSHTFTSVTPWNSSGTIGSYTLSGSPNLAPYVGAAQVRVSAGARTGNKCVIAKSLGSGAFRGNPGDQALLTNTEFVNGDSVQIYTVPKMSGYITIRARGSGLVVFDALEMGVVGQQQSLKVYGGNVAFVGSILRGLYHDGSSQIDVYLCGTHDLYNPKGRIRSSACVHFLGTGGAIYVNNGGSFRAFKRTLVQGGGIVCGDANEGPGIVSIEALTAVADTPVGAGAAVSVGPGGQLNATAQLVVVDSSAVPIGYRTYAGGRLAYGSSVKPLLAGTKAATEFSVGGNAKLSAEIAYADAASLSAVHVYQ